MAVRFNKTSVNLTSITSDDPIADVPCGDCTLCCQLLAPYLTPEEVSSGRYPLSLIQPSAEQLAVDPTIGPVVTVFKNESGGCSLLVDGRCSVYEVRPLACRKYDCRKGHHHKTNAVAREKFGVDL